MTDPINKHSNSANQLALERLDRLLNTAAGAEPIDSKELQARVLLETSSIQQQVPVKRGGFGDWFSLPKVVYGGAMATLFAALVIAGLPDQSANPSLIVETIETTKNSEFEWLTDQELAAEDVTSLLWDEVLLLEDELAFAAL